LKELSLPDYTYTCFDFLGPNNYGDTRCWIALYPMQKISHKEAYQFFVNLGAQPEAGRQAGYSLREALPNVAIKAATSKDVVRILSENKPGIVRLNKELRSYYKYSPGKQAAEWDRFYEEGVIALTSFSLPIGDLSRYESWEELQKASGFTATQVPAELWSLWFFKNAHAGDLVFAARGLNTCIGVGIVESDYYYETVTDGFCHRRRVKWLTNRSYHFLSGTLKGRKTLFRSDIFGPVKDAAFLVEQYKELSGDWQKIFGTTGLAKKSSYTGKMESIPVTNLEEIAMDYEREGNLSFWWLNANPKIWSISGCHEGQTQIYTTHNERGNKRRVYKYFEEVKPGDLLIGYESTPAKQVKAILEVTKGLHTQEGIGEVIEFQIAEIFEYPVHWNDLKSIPALKNCEVFINNQGSLFSLTEEEFDMIREVVDEKNISAEKVWENNEIRPYSFARDPDKPFMNPEEFRQITSLLTRKKNVILQGPPGVGKTFLAKKIAYEMMGETNDLCIEMVQFHQSYSYEDFIQGVRPSANGSFELKDGIFHAFCQRAKAHPEKNYFFIIDEINRGNLSKIFGELMMLIETDKRGWDLKLTYAEEEDERFSVPENLYLIGTMNTADRSLAIVDYALRRRFAFVSLQPDLNESFRTFLEEKGLSQSLTEHIIRQVASLNKEIREDVSLGEGFQIGHSYFCTYRPGEDENNWWQEIVNFELKPLLEELWFDDPHKYRQMLRRLEWNKI